jgi:hypothetical protein
MNAPIFVLGTGRCGSTHIQQLISIQTDCWIWGEHDGFLRSFLAAVKIFETSSALEEHVFHYNPTEEELVNEMSGGTTAVSWLNTFNKGAAREALKTLILETFSVTVPAGWSKWGFKEILYGLDNDVPEQLLQLFPLGKIIYSFRDPVSTIQSMIRAWIPDNAYSATDDVRLASDVQLFGDRWLKLMKYFIDLRSRQGSQVLFAPANLAIRFCC